MLMIVNAASNSYYRATLDITSGNIFFTQWINNLRNSLSAQVVLASSVNDFQNKLD